MAADEDQLQSLFDVGGSCSAISLSADGQFIAVGGRDVFKILTTDEHNRIQLHRSVRVKNLNSSTNDIDWNPRVSQNSLVATAGTNGVVALWDMELAGQRCQTRVLKDHSQKVNRVIWTPEDSILLSGSADGMVKMWDLRLQNGCVNTYKPRVRRPVHDVHVNRFRTATFASAYEDGTVLLWDMRFPDREQSKITAHSGPALSVDWHPSNANLLATAGRDRAIYVWDAAASGQPLHAMQTTAGLTQVAWRPGRNSEIASAALLMDFVVHVWDVHSPFVPVADFPGHRDAITDMVWRASGDELFTCAKDSVVIRHHIANAHHPHKMIRSTALSWRADDTVAAIINCVADSSEEPEPAEPEAPESPPADQTPARHPPSSPALQPALHDPATTHAVSVLSSLFGSTAPRPRRQARSRKRSRKRSSAKPQADALPVSRPHREFGVKWLPEETSRVVQMVEASADSTFVFCAKNYWFGRGSKRRDMHSVPEDDTLRAICDHNAQVALRAGQFHAFKLWQLISLLYCEFERPPDQSELLVSLRGELAVSPPRSPDSAPPSPSPDEEEARAQWAAMQERLGICQPGASAVVTPYLSSDEDHEHHHGVDDGDNNDNDDDDGLSLDSSEGSPVDADGLDSVLGDLTDDAVQEQWPQQEPLHSSGADEPHESPASYDSDEPEFDLDFDTGVDLPTDFLDGLVGEDDIEDDFIFDDDDGGDHGDEQYMHDEPMSLRKAMRRLRLGGPAEPDHDTQQPTSPSGHNAPPSLSAGHSPRDSPPASDGVQSPHRARLHEAALLRQEAEHRQHHEEVVRQMAACLPQRLAPGAHEHDTLDIPTLRTQILHDFLDWSSERGDVQLCVAVAYALRGRIELNERRLYQWCYGYVELLQRRQLYSLAVEIAQTSQIKELAKLNGKKSIVHLSCPSCSRPSGRPGFACHRCHATMTTCVVCLQPVRGLYTWCQGCGHGGHVQCLNKWFATNTVCPAGCLHQCRAVFDPAS